MAVMERRLQLLLDESRYARVARAAERSGRSVASVIREAIDLRFPEDADASAEAAAELLQLTSRPAPGRGEGPAELKAALEAALDGKVPLA